MLTLAIGTACEPDGAPVCDGLSDLSPDSSSSTLPGSSANPLTGAGGCSPRAAAYEVEVVDEVEYGSQHARQLLTAYLPVGLSSAPAMIFVHGGGWWYGSRHDFAERAQYFAERGIAAFNIEYVLADEDTPSFPGNVQDVVCAARFIKSNAEAFGIDPEAMAAYGASAGGHLAAMLGVLEGDEAILEGACGDPESSPKVRTVMNYFGYVDLEAEAVIDPEDWRTAQMLGATWDEDPELWRAASPATYVDPGDAVFVTGQGTDDVVVRPEISEAFHERLGRAGVPSVLVTVPEALHGFHAHPELDEPVRCAFEPLADLLLGAS